MKKVVIYTDGACTGNPGPGGYGTILFYQGTQKELSAGYRLTTNNRMEILACIAGLTALKESCEVEIYSDSKYVVDSMSKAWVLKWKANAWRRKGSDGVANQVPNKDLWLQMLELCGKHQVEFKWVRGHSGHEENERCDQLARAAAAAGILGIDVEYELISE